MEVRLIIIYGRAGSGKTSVANEMSEQLKRLDIRHAHIDGDNLDAMYPEEPAADMLLPNIAAMWANYYHLRGVDRLIISGTAVAMEMDRISRALEWACSEPNLAVMKNKIEGMPAASVNGRAFILQVSDGVAEKRLKRREVGSELEKTLASSRKMSAVLEEEVGGWARRVLAENREVREIALDILRTSGWI